jgi:hypothetical protein
MGDRRIKIAERGGTYDVATEQLRQRFAAEACLLIVLSGNEGTGVSIHAPESLKAHLPSLFRAIAQEVEDQLVLERHALFCPACHAPLCFDPRHGQPRTVPNGSISVCAACASFITFDEKWRVLTDDELVEIDDDVRIALIRTRREIERQRM